MSPMFEVEHATGTIPGGWGLVGCADDRDAAEQMVTEWARVLKLPRDAFRIRRVHPGGTR